jgi:hypothetical protein
LKPGKTFFIMDNTVRPSASRMSMSKLLLQQVGAQQFTQPLQMVGNLRAQQ